jgi:hypothetical protein
MIARGTFYQAAVAAKRDRTSHVTYFLQRFNRISVATDHATAGLIVVGGTMPTELKYYTRATARAFHETKATQKFTEAQRVAGAHQMLSVLTSRAAQHLDTVVDGRPWWYAERMHPHIEPLHMTPAEMTRAARIGDLAAMQLVGPDAERLFPVIECAGTLMAPLIRCPAHQRLFGTESALQLQLHAGINLTADEGLYHPTFVVPSQPALPSPSI